MSDWIDKADRVTEAAIPTDAAGFDALLDAARPVVLRGLVADWPAVAAVGLLQIGAFFAGPTDWASRDELVDRALAFGLGGTREAATRGVFLNSRVRADGRVEWKHHFAHLANALSADPAAAQQSAIRGALAASGWDDLAAVTAPITLVRGERGFVTPADADEFRRRLPSATLVDAPSGHNVQEEAPVLLAALIGDIARD